MPYKIPNFRHERHAVPTNIPVGPNRAPGNNHIGFMIESFVDEMAIAGGWDPLEWRIKMTEGNERWQRVLKKLKEMAGFTHQAAEGQGHGHRGAWNCTAPPSAAAPPSRSRAAASSPSRRSLIVHNAGWTINPRAAIEQMKSCVAWELSHTLYGGLTHARTAASRTRTSTTTRSCACLRCRRSSA